MTCCQTEVELLPAVQPDNFLFLPWSREPYKEVCFRCECIDQHNKLRALFHSAYSHSYNGVLCLRSAQADQVMALFRCTYSHAYGRVLCLRFVRPDQLMALFHCTYSVPTIECSVSGGGGGVDHTMAFFHCTYSHGYNRAVFEGANQLMALFSLYVFSACNSVLCLRGLITQWPCFTVHTHMATTECCVCMGWSADGLVSLYVLTWLQQCVVSQGSDQLMALFHCMYSHAYNSVLFLRSARADQPGQHMLHELHPAVADPHSHPAWLLPLRPAPLSHDCQPSAVPRLWNGPSLPGGEGFQHWKRQVV